LLRTSVRIEVDRCVERLQRFECAPQRNAEDPGRQRALQVVARGPAPDDQHRVVDDFVDKLRPSRHALDETLEPWIVAPVKRVECVGVPYGDSMDQVDLIERDARARRN